MESIKDRLIDWANSNGYWAKSLLSSCFCYGQIDNDKILEIIDNYKNNQFPEIIFSLKEDALVGKSYLKSISNIQNVNKLLSNQEMIFNDKLSVIYGSNGTGKTGYVRILKSMGNSLDSENIIYSDLTQEEISEHSANIRFNINNNDVDFVWNESNNDKYNIKIFNSNCVKFSLNNKKDVQFIPQDFNYFNIISTATSELNRIVKDKLNNLKDEMKLYAIIYGTDVSKLINRISGDGNIKNEINDYIVENNFKEDIINQNIEELEKKSKELNTEIINSKITKLIRIKDKLSEAENLIFINSGLYSATFWENYKTFLLKLYTLTKNNVRIEDFITDINLEEKQKQLLKEFLLSADEFLKSQTDKNFEDLNECIFCGQTLDKQSKNLLSSYTRFITNDNSREIKQFKDKLNNSSKKIKDCIEKLREINAIFEENSLLHSELKKFIVSLNAILEYNYDCELDENEFNKNSDFEPLRDFIKKVQVSYQDEINALSTQKNDLEKAISDNRSKINELNSIRSLLLNKDLIIKNLTEQRNLEPLSVISNKSLSAIQTNILTANYKQKFVDILNNELTLLEAPSNIKFSPNIVSSKLALKQSFLDKAYNLNNILSEGEQKVIALAHFITENLMEEKDNILVFDDPVNSLDLQRMETVARVLVQLANKKQTIIFTHNLVFVGFLATYANDYLESNEQSYICVERVINDGKEFTGQIKYEFPNIETYRNYKKLLNENMSNATKQSLSKDKMYECFEYMRSAIELLVVEKVFNGTVRRYEPDIKMSRFEAIDTEKLNKYGSRITALFNKLCRYIKAHSSSAQARIEPDFNVLQECYNEFKELDTTFKN